MQDINRKVVIKHIDEYRFRDHKAIQPVMEMLNQLNALGKQSAQFEKDNLIPLHPWLASGDIISLYWKFLA